MKIAAYYIHFAKGIYRYIYMYYVLIKLTRKNENSVVREKKMTQGQGASRFIIGIKFMVQFTTEELIYGLSQMQNL